MTLNEPDRPQVTVVTNDRETRLLLERALIEAGLQPLNAPNGLKLLSVLHVDAPDAILLDLELAWTDPFTLCSAMQNRLRAISVPIICFGADASQGQKCLDLGATGHLTKPVDTVALIQQLSDLGLLGARRARNEDST